MRLTSLEEIVVRVEMQSLKKVESANRPEKLNMWNTFKYIYQGMLTLSLESCYFLRGACRTDGFVPFALLAIPSTFPLLLSSPAARLQRYIMHRKRNERSIQRSHTENRFKHLSRLSILVLSVPPLPADSFSTSTVFRRSA